MCVCVCARAHVYVFDVNNKVLYLIVFFSVLIPHRTGPGELGKPVIVPAQRQQESKEKFKINQFNLVASDMISLNRSLLDYRMEG